MKRLQKQRRHINDIKGHLQLSYLWSSLQSEERFVDTTGWSRNGGCLQSEERFVDTTGWSLNGGRLQSEKRFVDTTGWSQNGGRLQSEERFVDTTGWSRNGGRLQSEERFVYTTGWSRNGGRLQNSLVGRLKQIIYVYTLSAKRWYLGRLTKKILIQNHYIV